MRKNYKPSHISRTPACVAAAVDGNEEELLRDVIDIAFATVDAGDDSVCNVSSMKQSRFCTEMDLETRTVGCASPYRTRLVQRAA